MLVCLIPALTEPLAYLKEEITSASALLDTLDSTAELLVTGVLCVCQKRTVLDIIFCHQILCSCSIISQYLVQQFMLS